MLLSVIIVNYNVRYFLEQCLSSVKKALEQRDGPGGKRFSALTEVLVIDNNSTDGSITYLQPRFSFVRFIANAENSGFGRANNQALAQSRGKYILFLNPDTVLPEDCFQQCLAFMDARPDAGALGIRMIDGSGRYLPESKRGFPTPWVSFCKMSGLTRLFPHSRLFARYYLGHLSSTETHPVDILSGAFLMARKEALEKTGGFDERFFMYAEDVDLSYRIQQAGYQNYYFAETTIVHFKGESTRRDARYVKQFYTAMIQFVEKHFKGAAAWWYIKLLQGIIKLKGSSKISPQREKALTTGEESIYLTGDEAGIEEMWPIATGAGKKISINPNTTPVLVLCEGDSCSFKKIIEELQRTSSKQVYIHALDTGSAVGSHSKSNQGNVIFLADSAVL
jgi:N-acetylglucosaminyl-diphospho-decaprenol L-rhamnosyltransferase